CLMYRNWFFCLSSLRIVAAVCFSLLGMSGFAAWHFTANVKVESKADFLLPIVYKPAQSGSSFTPRTLWLYPDNPLDVLVPETVEATSANTFIPVFFRTDEPARITIVDGADRSTSTIEVKPVAPGTPSKKPWLAYLRLRGEDE